MCVKKVMEPPMNADKRRLINFHECLQHPLTLHLRVSAFIGGFCFCLIWGLDSAFELLALSLDTK